MCNSLCLERSTHKIEIHETCQQVSVSEYKDYVQSVSQQADVLQHHMPGLCALVEAKKCKNALTRIPPSGYTHKTSQRFFFFFFEKESLTTPRGASHASMCPHAPTHVHAKHSSSALAFFAKEKVHLEISSSKFLPWISRCDLIFFFFFCYLHYSFVYLHFKSVHNNENYLQLHVIQTNPTTSFGNWNKYKKKQKTKTGLWYW